jgi:hypothetical protein
MSSIAYRVGALERRVRALEQQPPPHPAIFSMGSAGVPTTAYPCRDGGTIVAATAALAVAGTTATSGEIRKNGVALFAFSVPAGATQAEVGSGYNLNESDNLTGIVTSYGDGASGCTVYCQIVRNS